MVYNKYIGIIGGTGTIGSIIVKYLLQLQTHFHVLIGGRRSIKEISMSTFYNSERLKYNQMNYNNDVELDNFCSQCLLVINAVGPSFKINDKIALHALRNNCHYIDIGGYGILRDLLKPYEKSIEAQKLCFIIGVGWMPGISGVFSKTIIETHLNSPENTNFNIYYGAVDNWSYSSTYDLAASSMGKTRSYVYSHGKEIQVSPFRYTHHKFFPFIGHKKICMPSFDEQLTQLATSLKQIRKISTFIMLNDYISMGKFMFIKIFYKHNLNKATLMLQDDYQRLVKKENKWGSVICQVSKIEPERKIDTFEEKGLRIGLKDVQTHTALDLEIGINISWFKLRNFDCYFTGEYKLDGPLFVEWDVKDKSSGGEVPLVYYPPIVVVFPIAGPIHISVMVIPTLTMDCNAHAKGTIGITLPMTFDSSFKLGPSYARDRGWVFYKEYNHSFNCYVDRTNITYSGEVAASLGVYFKTEVNIAYCGGPFVKVGPSVSTDLSASVVTGSDYQFKVNTSGKFKLAGKTGAELHIVGYSLGKWETEYVLAEKDAWNKEFIVDMWPK